MGSSFAAFLAGNNPKINPIVAETVIDIKIENIDIENSQSYSSQLAIKNIK